MALPDLGDDTWVDTAVAVEGGVLLIVSGEILSQQFYLGTIDGGFVPVDGPARGTTTLCGSTPPARAVTVWRR